MRRNAIPLALTLALALVAAACESSTTTAPAPTTVATSTTVPTTASPTTTATTVAVPASFTTLAAAPANPTTTTPCPALGVTGDTNEGFPGTMTDQVGVAIRTGARPCYERVVIEFAPPTAGAGLGRTKAPGYALHYTRSPVTRSPSGEPRDVRGNAVLVVSFGAWMGNVEGDGYRGPVDITPTNVSHIRELVQIENFEGQGAWAIGVDAAYPYVVFTLSDPLRLVIDLLVS